MAYTITTDINGYDEPIWQVRDMSTTPSKVLKTFLEPEDACIWLNELEDGPSIEDFDAYLAEQEARADAEWADWEAKMEAQYGASINEPDRRLHGLTALENAFDQGWFGEVISKAKPGDDDYVDPSFKDEIPF